MGESRDLPTEFQSERRFNAHAAELLRKGECNAIECLDFGVVVSRHGKSFLRPLLISTPSKSAPPSDCRLKKEFLDSLHLSSTTH
jgi:hypothetical protein